MITPIEIQTKTFKSGGLGYDKKDVDSFLREVLKSYEIAYRENMELNDKVATLNQGIQYYKSIEKTLQKALVIAEKTAEETKAAAMDRAKIIEDQARTKAEVILADAKNELEHIHQQTIALVQQYDKYKAQFKHLAQAQVELIESDSFSIQVAKADTFLPQEEAAPAYYQQSHGHEEVYARNPEYSSNQYQSQSEYQPEQPAKEAAFELDDVDLDESFQHSFKEAAAAKEEPDEKEEFSFFNLVDEED